MVNIFHSVNAGLYFCTENTGVFIDGIHGVGPYQCFSTMPLDLRRQMKKHAGLFKHVNAVLFSHAHGDHYDQSMLQDFLDTDTDTRPDTFLYGGYQNTIAALQIHERIWCIEVQPFHIYAIKTRHQSINASTSRVDEIPNCCFLICCENMRFLIAADSEMGYEELQLLRCFGEVNMVFCNTYHLLKEKCAFFDGLAPQRLFVYHLPFAQDDIYSYQSLAKYTIHSVKIRCSPTVLTHMEWIDHAAPQWATTPVSI